MGDNTSAISLGQDQRRAIKNQTNQKPNEKKVNGVGSLRGDGSVGCEGSLGWDPERVDSF